MTSFDPASPMGRLLKKPENVKARATRMWRWKNRVLVDRIQEEIVALPEILNMHRGAQKRRAKKAKP